MRSVFRSALIMTSFHKMKTFGIDKGRYCGPAAVLLLLYFILLLFARDRDVGSRQ